MSSLTTHAIDGGGGGSALAGRTQRELMAFVASPNLTALDAAHEMWTSVSTRAGRIRDLIMQRLDQLTAEDGWTGPGAEAYRDMISHDLLQHLTVLEEQAQKYAANLTPVTGAVSSSHRTAENNNIPWDVATTWHTRKQDVSQTFWGKVDEIFTGDDDAYLEAQANAPTEIVNGGGAIVKTVPKPEWDVALAANPVRRAPSIFAAVSAPVSSQTHQFDRLMEWVNLNTGPRNNVYQSATQVESSLSGYRAEPFPSFEYRGGAYSAISVDSGAPTAPGSSSGSGGTTGTGTGSPISGSTATGTATAGTTTAGGTTGEGTATGGGGSPVSGGSSTGSSTGSAIGSTTGTGSAGSATGTGASGPGSSPSTVYTGPVSGVIGETTPGGGATGGGGTVPGGGGGSASVIGLTAPGTTAAGVSGIGAPGSAPAGPAAVMTGSPAANPGGIGSAAGAPLGATAMGGTAMGGAGTAGMTGRMAGGAPGTSFQMGANGKATINPGSTGSIAGTGSGDGAGRGGGTGSGTGTGAAGAPPAGRRRDQRDKDTEADPADGVWLEEEDSVWGVGQAAPPPVIR